MFHVPTLSLCAFNHCVPLIIVWTRPRRWKTTQFAIHAKLGCWTNFRGRRSSFVNSRNSNGYRWIVKPQTAPAGSWDKAPDKASRRQGFYSLKGFFLVHSLHSPLVLPHGILYRCHIGVWIIVIIIIIVWIDEVIFFSGVGVLEPAALEQSGLTLRCDESIKCRALAILQVRLDHNPSACAYPSVMSSPLRKPWNRAGKRSYAVPTVRTHGKLQLRFACLWAFVCLTRPIEEEWDENVVFHYYYYRWFEVCFLQSQAEYKRGKKIFFAYQKLFIVKIVRGTPASGLVLVYLFLAVRMISTPIGI